MNDGVQEEGSSKAVKLFWGVYETWLHMIGKASITFHWSFRNKLKGFEGLWALGSYDRPELCMKAYRMLSE